jgi:hypothetical protein
MWIKDLRKLNISLLVKWWWLLEMDEGLWQDIVKIKYIKESPTCLIPPRYNDSPIWCDLLKVRHIYLKGRELVVKNGKLTSFWLDPWLEEKPLCLIYPILYELCTNKKSPLFHVKQKGWVLEFNIRLPGIIRLQWYQLAHKLNQVTLEQCSDQAVWRWNASKKITVESVYEQLTKCDSGPSFKRIWKAKVPEKIKVLLNRMQFSLRTT